MGNQELWQSVLGEVELQISRPNFLTWLKQSTLVDHNEKEGVVLVGLPNNFAKEWVKNRYHKLLLGSLRNFDSSIRSVDYVVHTQNSPASLLNTHKRAAAPNPQASLMELKVDPKTNLNPRYTLQSYIVGSSNELAHAAIQAVIHDVGKKYNPLFIYGGVGLGKTHLIQAGGNEIQSLYKDSVHVLYVSSEKFINDVVWAIRNKRMEDIKKKYRDVDVLIVDDVQFIGGKPATEQEFFHTFNALYENNKQIVISSDRAPGAIPILEDRLRSRFEGGMIVDISYPDYETRLAIAKTKMQDHNLVIEDALLEKIAEKVQKNIRELEGVLNKVIFYQQFKHEKIDEKKLESIIQESTQSSSKHITAQDVVRVVAECFSVSPSDLTNRCRKREIVEPRQVCMYLLRDLLKLSYPFIGERLGKRDHTTAIHAYEKISEELTRNSHLNQKVIMIKDKLTKS